MNSGCFKKGNIPHNKGKKITDYVPKDSLEKIKETQFKKGSDHEGENHICWNGGVQKMTNDCDYIWKGNKERVRRPRMVYEKHFGKIPKGFVIYHKDGDKKNDHIDNLEAIPRKELLKRNKSKKRAF